MQNISHITQYEQQLGIDPITRQPPGVISKIVYNMKAFTTTEKIVILAVSILLSPLIILHSAAISGMTTLQAIIAAIIAPPLTMYILSDIVRAVKIVRRFF